MFTTRGHGLRGGGYTITGGYLSHSPLSIRFDGTRLVSDMAVLGPGRVGPARAARARPPAAERVRRPASSACRSRRTPRDAVAAISGRVGGRTVHLQTARAVGAAGVARL